MVDYLARLVKISPGQELYLGGDSGSTPEDSGKLRAEQDDKQRMTYPAPLSAMAFPFNLIEAIDGFAHSFAHMNLFPPLT